MKIIDELKYQVEQKMSKPNKDRILSNMDKVLFLTKILYDRMSLQDACNQLRIPADLGQKILIENTQLLKTKYKKNQKRPKKNKNNSSTESIHHSEPIQHQTSGVVDRQKCMATYKSITKDYDWRNFRIAFSVNGQTISDRQLDIRFQTTIKLPQKHQ